MCEEEEGECRGRRTNKTPTKPNAFSLKRQRSVDCFANCHCARLAPVPYCHYSVTAADMKLKLQMQNILNLLSQTVHLAIANAVTTTVKTKVKTN